MTRKLLIIGTLGLAVLMAPKSMGQLGQWDFNAGNLSQSSGATLGDLTYHDAATSSGTAFGSCSSFGIPNIGTSNALVMRFPTATNGMGYLMPTPAANGGSGSTVSEWTLIFDVLYPVGSDAVLRPIIDSDGTTVSGGGLFIGPDLVVSATDGVGRMPSGPFNGTINPNTWYRIGISVTASEVDIYVDGNQVYSGAGAGLDSQLSLTASSTALVLGSITNQAAPGYVNSIQLRAVALNAGQMLALGAATGGGIPQTIPPVPAFIQVRTPGVSATRVSPTPSIHVVLNQGDATVTSGSVKLFMDGALVSGASIVETPPTFDVAADISTILDPNSLHTLSLVWQDSMNGNQTNTWNFTVIPYQNLNLPAPFYFENFNGLTESATAPAPLPAGWTVTNQTTHDTPGYDIANRDSDAYLDWVLVASSRFQTWGSDRTALPPIVLNGSMLTSLTDGNLMWAESDSRCGSCQGQYQEMYTADINCTGRTNVYVAWKSIYMQNQDNMNLCEYSIDQGVSWKPVRYLFCTLGNGESSDIYYTNGVIDVGQTFNTVDPNRNWSPDASPVHSTNYGIYVKAPISANMIPYIVGYTNDDNLNGKEIVVVRLPQADGQPKVRFRFLDTGTSAWFWGIDDLGLYEINTPVITGQPTNVTVSAGSTAIFSVAATSPTALTYHWKHAGTNLSNGGHYSGATNATLTVSNSETNDAGAYVCVVANTFGSVSSASVNLTVVTAPQITSQPTTVVSSIGGSVALNVSALGRPPLVYQWLKNGTPTGPNGTTLSFPSVQLSNADRYQVNITNSEGAALSRSVRVVVSPDDLTSNLVVHITFDGNYSDTSGHTNDATPITAGSAPDGGPALVAGKLGQALRFTTKKDGSVFDYATLGYPSDLKFGSDVDYSVSFWCNYTGQSDDPPLISNKNWDSSGNRGWGVFTQSDGHYRVNITGAGGTKYDIGSGATPLIMNGVWHNIIVSHARANGGSGIVSVYNDGVLVTTRDDLTTGSVDTDDLGYAVNLGQDGRGTYTDGGSAGITNALLDDVGIWRRALSSQEAAGIYNAGQSGKNIAQAVSARKLSFSISGSNLVITWTGSPALKLQSSPTLSPATWTDVPGTLGASIATVPITGSASFFKLAQ